MNHTIASLKCLAAAQLLCGICSNTMAHPLPESRALVRSGQLPWVQPGIANCKILHHHADATLNAPGHTHVLPQLGHALLVQAKGQQGGDPPVQQGGQVQPAHAPGHGHTQTQRIALGQSTQLKGAANLSFRIDTTQLATTMRQYLGTGAEASFEPSNYHFQAFRGQLNDSNEHVAHSTALEIAAGALTGGQLTLSLQSPSARSPGQRWTVVIRATAPGHEDESPQLRCQLRE